MFLVCLGYRSYCYLTLELLSYRVAFQGYKAVVVTDRVVSEDVGGGTPSEDSRRVSFPGPRRCVADTKPYFRP